MGYVLLVGNGINRVSTNGPSWRSVIDSIATQLDHHHILKRLDLKPFTLAFDELILLSERNGAKRIDVERLVAEQIQKLRPGIYHERLMRIGISHIITTNYDHALELAIDQAHSAYGDSLSKKYNLFRRRLAESVNVWHIHGDVDNPRSIILGYDNYTGTVQRLREYLKIGYKSCRSPFRKGNTDFDKGGITYSWVDLFLRDDVHVVGFGLEYTEIDIWWLIYYKATMKNRGKNVGGTHYYRFSKGKSSSNELGKLDLLKALGVKVHTIQVKNSYEAAWNRLLIKLEKEVS